MASHSTVRVHSLSYTSEDWPVPEPEKRSNVPASSAKRRRVHTASSPASDTDQHVWLIHRRLEMSLSDPNEIKNLVAGVCRSRDSTWAVDLHLHTPPPETESEDSDHDMDRSGQDRLMSIEAFTPEGIHRLMKICFRPEGFDTAARTDLEFANEVHQARRTQLKCRTPRLEAFCDHALLHLRKGANNTWGMEIEVYVTAIPQNDWSEGSLMLSKTWWRLLAWALPTGMPAVENAETLTTKEFYAATHVPRKDIQVPDSVQHPVLNCTLLPFQRRAVAWMLGREGVQLNPSGGQGLLSCEEYNDNPPPMFFREVDRRGAECFVSHVLGIVSKDLREIQRNFVLNGGILAEEMGLGKTVEIISTLTLHRRQEGVGRMVYDAHSERNVTGSGSTLIITPASILGQWEHELLKHSPDLNVYVYKGAKKAETEDVDTVEKLCSYEIVLTTYDVLSSEYHYAQEIPMRNMRHERVYEIKRSPLMEISWWRCCLDEAQMVDGGVSNAARLAQDIPRVNSWAVSGTPVRKDVDDLHGLLLFLRYAPFNEYKDAWLRVLHFNHLVFDSIFRKISLRHTKEIVNDEVALPRQRRVVVTIPFTQVERHNYADLFEQMCKECSLAPTGEPLGDSQPDLQKLGRWLIRLRQTCLHPEAGEANRQAFGVGNGPPRSIGKVLDVMIDQIHTSIRADERNLLASRIKRGQILDHENMVEPALALWESVLKDLKVIITECRTALVDAQKHANENGETSAATRRKGKRKADEYEEIETLEDTTEDADPKSSELSGLKMRLRTFLELEHACLFWIATAYYQRHEKFTASDNLSDDEKQQVAQYQEMEAKYYELAKRTRLEMMREARAQATRLMDVVQKKANAQAFVEIPPFESLGGGGGIESRRIFEAMDELSEQLDNQAALIDEWREKLIQLLLKPLVDSEDDQELKGDEFEVSVEEQERSFAFLSAIRAAVADRDQCWTSNKNTLVDRETKEALRRPNRIHNSLFTELVLKKDAVKPREEYGNVKKIANQLRSLITKLKGEADDGNKRAVLELSSLTKQNERLQMMMKTHLKTNSDLEKELSFCRSVINARVLYYRQVQVVSTTVEPLEPELEFASAKPDAVMARMVKAESKIEKVLARERSRKRFLENLKDDKTEGSSVCKICHTDNESGVMTACGHAFCKECLQIWLRNAKVCPACRMTVRISDLRQITYHAEDVVESQKPSSLPRTPPQKESPTIYADVGDQMLQEIGGIELRNSYGSKIDMITRHLLWLKEFEPGFKAVIFSQWSDVLEVVKRSLDSVKIGYASLERKGKKGIENFRHDPETSCFFLHGHSRSTGLNLVNATHIFLCEPLVNVPLELQAISRIHRIGQKEETTVWLYTVEGTVEQNILASSTQRRLALLAEVPALGNDPSWVKQLDAAESRHLRLATSKLLDKTPGGGELVGNDDVWSCLFSNVARGVPGIEASPADGSLVVIPDNLPVQLVVAS